MRKITKAVIPAAGHGTRFLPVTKAVPKEMLAIIDKPAVHYIAQEAADSGITDILFVVSRDKAAIKNYFPQAVRAATSWTSCCVACASILHIRTRQRERREP